MEVDIGTGTWKKDSLSDGWFWYPLSWEMFRLRYSDCPDSYLLARFYAWFRYNLTVHRWPFSSIESLAEYYCIPATTIRQWFRGERMPKRYVLLHLMYLIHHDFGRVYPF